MPVFDAIGPQEIPAPAAAAGPDVSVYIAALQEIRALADASKIRAAVLTQGQRRPVSVFDLSPSDVKAICNRVLDS